MHQGTSTTTSDEMALNIQMARAFNDAWGTCDAHIKQFRQQIGDLHKQDPFTIFDDIEFNVDGIGLYESREGVLESTLNDLHFLKLMAKSKIPLFEGSGLNILIGTLMISNTSATHKCTNGFVDELWSLLCNSIFLKLHNLPKSHYEAKSLISNLGLGHNTIHACENCCVFFCNEHSVAEQCPICA
jgi:hypothetical protein